MISLRDYQNDTISAVQEAQSEGHTRLMAVLPTGCGKTIVFAELARQMRRKTLILAHRDELIKQAADKVSMVWPDAVIGIVKGKDNDFHHKNVVCASVQTLGREKRLRQLLDEDFGLLVIDEAHHAMAKTYRDIINNLGFGENDPNKLLFGVTATPSRMDNKGLGAVFQKVVSQVSILTMIRAGYLADIRGYRAQTETDLSGIGTRHGDYIESQLAQAVNTDERNKLVVDNYFEHSFGRKTIAFCANVQHAEDLAEMFTENGMQAKALSGSTPDEERAEALQAFSRGEIEVLTNCALFTEGFDEPSIGCVLMCRPTKSQAMYTQCIGRGTRRHPGKADCIVIDFCDNRHDICSLPQLFGWDDRELTEGKTVKEEDVKKKEEKEKSIGYEQLTLDLPPVQVAEFDLLNKSQFRWIFDGEQWSLPVEPGVRTVLMPDGSGRFLAFLTHKDCSSELLHHVPLDLGYGQGVCEDYVRSQGSATFSKKNAPWRKKEASEKQIELLKKIKRYRDNITKGEATDIIERYIAEKQAKVTKKQLSVVG